MERNEAASVIQRFLTCRDIRRDDCCGHCETCRYNTEYDERTEALKLAIKALGKDTNAPTNSALDHIHNVVRDDAYRRGYEQGKKDAKVEAIPVDWFENFLREESNKGLKSDALLVAYGIIILCKWKEENDGKIN